MKQVSLYQKSHNYFLLLITENFFIKMVTCLESIRLDIKKAYMTFIKHMLSQLFLNAEKLLE